MNALTPLEVFFVAAVAYAAALAVVCVASAIREARWRRRNVLLQLIMELDGDALGLIKRAAEDGVVLWPQQVYPILRELEREGVIASYEVPGPPERGGRPRIYYRYRSVMRELLGVDIIEAAERAKREGGAP